MISDDIMIVLLYIIYFRLYLNDIVYRYYIMLGLYIVLYWYYTILFYTPHYITLYYTSITLQYSSILPVLHYNILYEFYKTSIFYYVILNDSNTALLYFHFFCQTWYLLMALWSLYTKKKKSPPRFARHCGLASLQNSIIFMLILVVVECRMFFRPKATYKRPNNIGRK